MARFGIVRSARLSSTPTMIAGPSEQRVALLFSSPTIPGTSYTVSTDAAVTLGGGINLSVGATPIEVSISSFGDAPQKPWYGVSSAGLATIGFLETIDVSLPKRRKASSRKTRPR